MIGPISLCSAVFVAGLSVLIHFECLSFLNRGLERFRSSRARLLATMIGLLTAHVIEIWLYAGAYYALITWTEVGAIHTGIVESQSLLDLVYYSAMVYTTVGFGDMIPSGGIRLVTATEALVGLSLITWSASFTYFQMQVQFGHR